MTNDELKEEIKAINCKLDAIHTQVLKTNGRVNSLEFFRKSVIWVGCAIVLPVLGAAGTEILKLL